MKLDLGLHRPSKAVLSNKINDTCRTNVKVLGSLCFLTHSEKSWEELGWCDVAHASNSHDDIFNRNVADPQDYADYFKKFGVGECAAFDYF